MEYTREQLIQICDRAIVPVDKWGNRDSPIAQTQVGECWALLKAGCKFEILKDTNSETILIEIRHPNFYSFEYDRDDLEERTFYLPTEARLESRNGSDWY